MIDIFIWIFVIWFVIQIFNTAVGFAAMKEVREQVKDHLNKIIHEVSVEKHGDVEYWFDKDSGEFLGQGQSISEITDHVKSRFPDHIFVLPPKGVLCAPTWEFMDKIDPNERIKHYANK